MTDKDQPSEETDHEEGSATDRFDGAGVPDGEGETWGELAKRLRERGETAADRLGGVAKL